MIPCRHACAVFNSMRAPEEILLRAVSPFHGLATLQKTYIAGVVVASISQLIPEAGLAAPIYYYRKKEQKRQKKQRGPHKKKRFLSAGFE